MSQVFFSLGTNLGERRTNLCQAIKGLGREVNITAVSSIYETEPWGVSEQPSFLNLCAAAVTEQQPEQLLTFVKALEIEIGRRHSIRWGPRLIDIDILFYDNLVLDSQRLTIPHPCLSERAFVLAPLNDIAPQLVHPRTGLTVKQMLAAIDSSMVQQLPNSLFQEQIGD